MRHMTRMGRACGPCIARDGAAASGERRERLAGEAAMVRTLAPSGQGALAGEPRAPCTGRGGDRIGLGLTPRW